MAEAVDRGRDAYNRQAWLPAYESLTTADRHEPLEVEDLERLAAAAYLVGRSEESSDVWARAHQECARIGEVARAARCAFWIAFMLINNFELARGGGWVDRAQRLLDDRKLDCVEQGYLRYAAALRSVFSGDLQAGLDGFARAAGTGERFLDAELTTLARIGQGRCLIFAGRYEEGLGLLDEAMVAVGAREISPIAVGDSYCTVIEGCHELFDIGRADEWTTAFTQWCESQPDLVLYRGQCLMHRAELLKLRGAWSRALEELTHTADRLADPTTPRILATVRYLQGELHLLRGDLSSAEEAFRTANQLGRDPQPGLALLRLAQGKSDAADATIRRALQETEDPLNRARLLGPYVEIVLASQADVEAARTASDELGGLAGLFGKPFLRALSAQVAGAVRLAADDAEGALVSLRQAGRGWRELDAPYAAARTRVLLARACRALGDDDGAEMELDAASTAFGELGARRDLDLVASLSGLAPPAASSGLSSRELEVLGLLAKGLTNREIATQLVISEKTVASHVSHIFTKLDLTSRAAATGYAYEHGLV
jgi:DNA-binding CsgD family transcriptional regulator